MKFIDLDSQYTLLKSKINSRIQKVLEHGQFIGGPEVGELEARLQSYLGIKHAITCANGTDALVLSLMALGVKKGDAVFCPSFTFFSTAEAVAICGAVPIFVDCDKDTFNISPSSLEKSIIKVTSSESLIPKVIITVDLFGLPADFYSIKKIATKYQLRILEDAAQGFGGQINGTNAGNFGDISITSFFPAKPLGCYGDGGAVFTSSDDNAELIRSLANHGKGKDKYDNVRIGMNSRLDTIQAAILLEKLEVLPGEIEVRNKIANIYNHSLEGHVTVPTVPKGYMSSWAQYTIKSPNRDEIKSYLADRDIPSMVYYKKCLHEQKAFTDMVPYSINPDELKESVQLAREVLSLPMHAYLSEDNIHIICESIKSSLL